MLEPHIQQQFFESADLMYQSAEMLATPIANGAAAIVEALTGGGKVLVCGNGGSAASAQQFAALFASRFERERPGLSAISLGADTSGLTTIAHDFGFDQIFARQVQALGNPGDILVAISIDGNSADVLAAVGAAHEREMSVIALTGKGGGTVADALLDTDVHVTVPHDRNARIQEVHLLALHCLCDGVDRTLLGVEDA